MIIILILLGVIGAICIVLIILDLKIWETGIVFAFGLPFAIIAIVVFFTLSCCYIGDIHRINYLNKKYEMNYTADDYFFNKNDINEEIKQREGE